MKKALRKLIAELLSIPLRSPDLNPMENLFNSVRSDLSQQALSQILLVRATTNSKAV